MRIGLVIDPKRLELKEVWPLIYFQLSVGPDSNQLIEHATFESK